MVLSVGLLVVSVCSAEESAVSETDERITEAEQELAEEIRRVYAQAHLKFRMKSHAEAERLFRDCYALYQASVEHLSDPEDLAPMVKDCERHLEDLSFLRKREAAAGGWQARLKVLRLKQFRVSDAELGKTLEYFRQRVAETMRADPPDFVFLAGIPNVRQRVTLDLEDVNAIDILQELAQRAGWEVRFEKQAIVFAETAKVQ